MEVSGYILTWHYLDNYGSVLQAYALQEVLKEKGLKVKILNYRKGAKIGITADILRFIKYNLPTKNLELSRKQKFYKFRKKYLSETKMLGSIEQLKKINFDDKFIICGSDQIWSSKNFNLAYFLNFTENSKVKKYSYAPSTIEPYNKIQIVQIKKALASFQKISVREEIGKEILSNITSQEIIEVLDPTVILTSKKWEFILKKETNKIKEYKDYVLCYFIGEDDKYKEITTKIKKIYKCQKIININIKNIHNFGDKIIKNASPIDFLNLIKNAKVIVSDSYHAILFSIIFNKEFYAIKRFEDNEKDNQNERIRNILSKIDCNNRFVYSNETELDNCQLSYKKINEKLEKYKKRSNDYLSSIIEEVNNFD